MAGERKHNLIWAVTGLVAAAVLTWFLLSGSQPMPQARLPDGSTITLEGILKEKVHVSVYGNAWQRFAVKHLPDAAVRALKIRASVFHHTNTSAAAIVLVKYSATNLVSPTLHSSSGLSIRSNPAFPTGYLLTDDVGNEFDVRDSFGSRWASNVWEAGFFVPLTSRLAKEYRMRFYFSDIEQATNFLADFKFAQPVRSSVPPWPPATLPQTNKAGALTMILAKLTPLPPLTRLYSGEGYPAFETLAKYRIIENGNVSIEWDVSSVTVLDEEGNKYPPPNWIILRGTHADGEIKIPGHFSPLETRKFKFKLSGPRGTTSQEVDFLARPEGGPIKNSK
jgi:hypothetical protein